MHQDQQQYCITTIECLVEAISGAFACMGLSDFYREEMGLLNPNYTSENDKSRYLTNNGSHQNHVLFFSILN